ncbi:aspartate aminotransferase family protein [Mesorhizobium sp. WSM4307]|uniref:pyridoxal phosphate-dependent decarboxylase family protein n=1 Tax=unclassified Mesorhizobium TaxID=325217 RepID=UPI000BB03B20|nr:MULTISPECIES: pyridoxal-dependent decarboxylase [unclassified Mesorhizobium]PBB25258.1 aspartate aminotransferase family protein [Mesorhizobium sp. WSM4304]PBB74856.1 aspartate aminotransferase family protein [Mesorhizobium sp. WSM4308]PBC22894.1 aspartate aminotransferase family protein [Mesorhizobium sp. WSM4311]TRC72661.1 aspartate aminotransferase family protein [Mesorhizobium sp. WSM4315]TRC73966.1 aspartate aminotransferase family protein [Mesorhizobium sp. WSM4310]
MTPEEFRQRGHEIIDWLADYHAKISDYPVQPATRPGDVKAMLPAVPPVEAEGFDQIIADLDSVVLPNISHWQHPRFFGYFPSNSLGSGILGDLVSGGLGVLGLSWQSSPAVTEIEEVTLDWFRQMVGLSSAWFGVINDTASTSTLVALLCAREKTTGFSLARQGLQAELKPLTIYTSTSAHSSVEKAALLAGFGRENVRMVDVDVNFAMHPAALQDAIDADIRSGFTPCAIVAAVGGTATVSIDPVSKIADIARRHGLWLHIDAAMAGNAMILPELRWMWEGIEEADSVVINAHKWLGVPFDCSLYFVRDEPHLLRVMSADPSFLQSQADEKVRNLRNTGIPLGRRFRALKLWFAIREQGVSGLQARLRRDIGLAQDLRSKVEATPDWEVVAPVVLQTVCLVYRPKSVPSHRLDDFTRAWANAVNASGQAYVTPAIAAGHWMVRVSVGTISTDAHDTEAVWGAMQKAAAALVPEFS